MIIAPRTSSGSICPLCGGLEASEHLLRGRSYRACAGCGLLHLDPTARSSRAQARERYLLHRNGPDDAGYCDHLRRAVDAALPYLTPGSRGLDYGCGPVPTLSGLLREHGYRMTDYDPLFHDTALEPSYDFIFSTECFEHFEEPRQEIGRVVDLVAPGGILTVMTELWDGAMDLERWHYLSDPTHVSLYSERTFEYLCGRYGLERVHGDGRKVLVLRKRVGPVTSS